MVRITEQSTNRNGTRTHLSRTSYIASSLGDCRCGVARFAYELAVQFDDTITVGCIVAEPVRA